MTIDPATAQDAQQVLLDSLLYSVSHDLRSPLLTMSLSTELLEASLTDTGDIGSPDASTADRAKASKGATSRAAVSEGTTVALASLRQGAADLERMLQALMELSRARRNTVEPVRSTLQLILAGYRVTSPDADDTDLRRRVALVDPVQVREMLDAVAGDASLAVKAHLGEDFVDLELAVPQLEHGPTPLHAIAASLKQYAATPVEALAVGQVLLERQGGTVRGEGGRVVIRLPLSESANESSSGAG